MPRPRNVLIFASIAAFFVFIYIFFVRSPSAPEDNLIATSPILPGIGDSGTVITPNTEPESTSDFLVLLLSVKNIKLEDSIFSDPAWANLKDSSIELVPDGTEGRPNPFAPFGTDASVVPPAPPASTAPASSSPPDPSVMPGAGSIE